LLECPQYQVAKNADSVTVWYARWKVERRLWSINTRKKYFVLGINHKIYKVQVALSKLANALNKF